MNVRLKNTLFTIVMIGLFAPLAQQLFNIPQPGLKGSYLPTEKPVLSLDSWLEGSWQQRYSDYYETTFGFRPWFIKIKNHIEFNLFRKVHSGMILGKDDNLFEKAYIDAYLGKDRIPFDSAQFQIEKLMYIQKYLSKKNIRLLTILAPGKGSFCAQYIPDELHPENRNISNYTQYRLLFERSHLPYIDFNEWFLTIKDTSTRLLYTKFGIHWSAYSTHYVTDSLIRKMQSLTGKEWGYYTSYNERQTKTPKEGDDDLMEILNTMGTRSGDTYSYINVKFHPTGKLPKVLIIGDSYVWTPINHGALMSSVADGSQYLYYNHDVYTYTQGQLNPAGIKEKSVVPKDIEDFDFIILCNTEPNLKEFGSGFIDAYYQELTGTDKAPSQLRGRNH